MTPEEILMMRAGRDLNIRVAEDVMGDRFVTDEIFGDIQIGDDSAWMPLQPYSEDEAVIGDLLTKLRLCYGTTIDLDCFQGTWRADVNVDGEGVQYYYPEFNAISLTEAICKAALLLVHTQATSPDCQPV